jgi:hypothetical protein
MTQQALPESGSGTQAVAVLVGSPAWGAVSEGFGFGVDPSAVCVLSLPAVPVVAVWDGWTGGFAEPDGEAAGVFFVLSGIGVGSLTSRQFGGVPVCPEGQDFGGVECDGVGVGVELGL